jgi:hypothetical protein
MSTKSTEILLRVAWLLMRLFDLEVIVWLGFRLLLSDIDESKKFCTPPVWRKFVVCEVSIIIDGGVRKFNDEFGSG